MYYKHVYASKPMFEGIDLIAKFEKISKKQAAHHLLEEGFRYYCSEKVRQDIEARTAARKLNQKVRVSKFIIELEKYCKEQGIDISKAVGFLESKLPVEYYFVTVTRPALLQIGSTWRVRWLESPLPQQDPMESLPLPARWDMGFANVTGSQLRYSSIGSGTAFEFKCIG